MGHELHKDQHPPTSLQHKHSSKFIDHITTAPDLKIIFNYKLFPVFQRLMGSGAGSPGGCGGGGGVQGDAGKKMMHHCHICNRGFLNKSNIKVSSKLEKMSHIHTIFSIPGSPTNTHRREAFRL